MMGNASEAGKVKCDGCERFDVQVKRVIGGHACKQCVCNDELWEMLPDLELEGITDVPADHSAATG